MVTRSRSIQKQVVIESLDAVQDIAVVKDGSGMRHRVSLKVQRVGIAPSVNEVWMVDKEWGNWTLSARLSGGDLTRGGGGSSHEHRRQKTSYTTGDLAQMATEVGEIELASHYVVLYIETSVPARVRLYNNVTDRDADLGRDARMEPVPGMGIVMDYITADFLLSASLTPVPHGASFAEPPVATHPISVTSVAGGPVTVTLTWVSEE